MAVFNYLPTVIIEILLRRRIIIGNKLLFQAERNFKENIIP